MYNVMVGGSVVGTYKTKEEASVRLEEVKNSFLAMVHPRDTMFIKKIS